MHHRYIFLWKTIYLEISHPLVLRINDSPWCCWALLFKGLNVSELHSLSSTSGLKNIALKQTKQTDTNAKRGKGNRETNTYSQSPAKKVCFH